MSWDIWDSEDLGSLTLPLGLGIPGTSWDIRDSQDLDLSPYHSAWESQGCPGIYGIPKTWISHPITRPGNPRDVLGYLGLWGLGICHPITRPGNPRDLLGYLGLGLKRLGISHPAWESQGHHGISKTWDLSPYHSVWESQGHPGISETCYHSAWECQGCPEISLQSSWEFQEFSMYCIQNQGIYCILGLQGMSWETCIYIKYILSITVVGLSLGNSLILSYPKEG